MIAPLRPQAGRPSQGGLDRSAVFLPAGPQIPYVVRGTILERFFASPRHCF
jgi:hypothetical protein